MYDLLSSNLSKLFTFAVAPLVLTPFARNQDTCCHLYMNMYMYACVYIYIYREIYIYIEKEREIDR